MSQENVDIVRRAIEAITSANPSMAEDLIALADPEIEFRSALTALDGSTYHGPEGMRRYASDLQESWREWDCKVIEIEEMGPRTILGTLVFRAMGKDSGVSVERGSAIVCRFSEGKLLFIESFSTREEAVESMRL